MNEQTRSDKKKVFKLAISFSLLIIIAIVITFFLWRSKGWGEDFFKEESVQKTKPLPIRAGAQKLRSMTVSGQFYPADPKKLYMQIGQLLASSPKLGLRGTRAILVPHAGYVYSGEVAAASFREIDPNFRRVFILAANHNSHTSFSGVSIPNVTHYAIPGAEIPLSEIVNDLIEKEFFSYEPAAHTMHMIEVELPFLHYLRGRSMEIDFTIVPMILGKMTKREVEVLADILRSYNDGETLFVFSVDLSHFYSYQEAEQLDAYTVETILSRDKEMLSRAVTDGNQVLQTMVSLAEKCAWEPSFILSRNSGDVSGDRDRVVGYASIVFHEKFSLNEQERRELLFFARNAIEEYLQKKRTLKINNAWLEKYPIFRVPRGIFVTLKKDGRLRGCIGGLVPEGPIYQSVAKAAISAALRDPRFSPVDEKELNDLTLSISILSFPTRVNVNQPEEYLKILRPFKDGVILMYQGKRSTFLPQVWHDIPDAEEFLGRLCLKLGVSIDAWKSPDAVLYRYHAYEFGEDSSRAAD